jgi:hypothetical protein
MTPWQILALLIIAGIFSLIGWLRWSRPCSG